VIEHLRTAYENAAEHLQDELAWLGLLLLREVGRFRAAHPEPGDGFQGIYIGDAEVDRLLVEVLGSTVAPRPDNADAEQLTARAEAGRAVIDARLEASSGAGVLLPVERLARRFDLAEFDRAALLLAAAPDLDRRFETLYAYLLDDVTKRRPTTGLALALASPRAPERWILRGRLEPGAPLVDERLLVVEGDGPFLSRPLRVDDRVLDELLGTARTVDALLRQAVEPASRGGHLWQLPRSAALEERLEAIANIWREHPGNPGRRVFHPLLTIEAARGSGLDAAAFSVAARLGRPVLRVRVDKLPTGRPSATEAVAVLRREALLRDAVLVLEECHELARSDNSAPELRLALESLAREAPVPLVLVAQRAAELRATLPELPVIRLELPADSVDERRRLWTEALERQGLNFEPLDAARTATTFALTPGQIERAAAGAGHRASMRGGGRTVVAADLNAAARAESHQGLDALARRIEPLYTWTDIVLPPATFRQLQEIAAAAQHRSTVLSDWGLGRKLSRGRGLNVLFSGASGTGKTMAAEVIAGELGLDLFQIDLATVVSKYIGETEKNLKRIFDEAETSNAVLFFDEADALFGKRSEVRDSHDRYANIEIAYLLQLMEQYEGGMAILATNLSQNVDEAFSRRMQYLVEFPLPDASLREQIWTRMFPPEAPVGDEVDLAYLARQFELAGGSIRGAALTAATMAAADGGVIHMPHLALAVAREYQKLGRLPSQGEFGPWYGDVLAGIGGVTTPVGAG
jgi:ATPase family associated with various cellular activities (AAA)